MATYNFLDKTGLGLVWAKIKGLIPSKTSELQNDSGFITSYTETDPVYSASPAASITATDISNWNAKSDTDEKVKVTQASDNNTYNLIFGKTSEATAARQWDSSGLNYIAAHNSQNGYAELRLGNGLASGTSGSKYGAIRLYGTTATYATTIKGGAATAWRTITLPDATGTVALTSDIPTVPTKTSDLTNDSDFITLADLPIYDGSVSTGGGS